MPSWNVQRFYDQKANIIQGPSLTTRYHINLWQPSMQIVFNVLEFNTGD